MTEAYARRAEDKLGGKLLKIWPIIAAFALLAAAYGRYDQKLQDTVRVASETVSRVNAIERKLDVQEAILLRIEKAVVPRRRDD